jgi:hypothetical protein
MVVVAEHREMQELADKPEVLEEVEQAQVRLLAI